MSDPIELAERLFACDEILQQYGESDLADPVASARVAVALRDKALVLRELGRQIDALALWEEILDRYADAPPSGQESILLEAGYGRVSLLDDLGRDREASDACDRLLARWLTDARASSDEVDELDRAWHVAAALIVKVRVELKQGNHAAALRATEAIVDHYRGSTDPFVESIVLTALGRRVQVLLTLGRNDEAMAASRVLSGRFDGTTDRDILLDASDQLIQTAGWLALPTLASRQERACALAFMALSAAHLLEVGRRVLPTRFSGRMLARQRRLDEARRLLEILDARLDETEDPELALMLARARDQLSNVHILSGHFAEGSQVLDRLFELGEPAVRMLRAQADAALARDGRIAGYYAISALFGLTIAYRHTGQATLAADTRAECITRFAHIRAPAIQLLLRLTRP